MPWVDQITIPPSNLIIAIICIGILSGCKPKPGGATKEGFGQNKILFTTQSQEALAEFQRGVDQLDLGLPVLSVSAPLVQQLWTQVVLVAMAGRPGK